MALPSLATSALRAAMRRAKKNGPLRDRGKFISETGWMKAERARREAVIHARGVEQYLRAELGAPPSGLDWFQIASKYSERFADYLQDRD